MILDGSLKDGEYKFYKDLGNGWVEEIKPPISAYESIDVAEFNEVVDRYKTIPNYDLLIKENNKLAYKWNELIKRLMSKFNETQVTFYLDIIQMMEEIDNKFKSKGDK